MSMDEDKIEEEERNNDQHLLKKKEGSGVKDRKIEGKEEIKEEDLSGIRK